MFKPATLTPWVLFGGKAPNHVCVPKPAGYSEGNYGFWHANLQPFGGGEGIIPGEDPWAVLMPLTVLEVKIGVAEAVAKLGLRGSQDFG